MKFMFPIIALFVLASASAQARVDSRSLTCAQAKAYVQQNGAVILQTGTHTYDRYVAHQGYCSHGERAVYATVPTLDDDTCYAGSVCRQHDSH